MYRNVVALVLALNALTLVVIGIFIASSARPQLQQLGIDASQIESIVPTYYGLGLADASSSIFSLLASFLVYRKRAGGKILGSAVAANQLVVGCGLFLLTGVPLALYFIALRGVVIGLLVSRLPASHRLSESSA